MPRRSARSRPPEFHREFDRKTLYYDCFRHRDGRRVVLIGPPPYGIDYQSAVFSASGARVTARMFPSLSTMTTVLTGVPTDAHDVAIDIAGERVLIPVNSNASEALGGSRAIFAINRDNDLAWIEEWARYHVRAHGADTVILFDNGSSRYDVPEISAALQAVAGVGAPIVIGLPGNFGPFDPAVFVNPEWARFLQIGAMSIALRRFGARAFGLLNCDIDELVGTHSGSSIYDLAARSRGGLVVYRGTWIESGSGRRHRDFVCRLVGKAAISTQRKWCLDPTREWIKRLSVHPYWHWIAGRPPFSKTMSRDATYWHFRAINTNWKEARSAQREGETEQDRELSEALRHVAFIP